MTTAIRVEELRGAGLAPWNLLVAESPAGSVYSLPSYLDVLCRAAGGRFSVLAALQGDELIGGVALYERDSRYGPYVSPRRLLYYNGVVLKHYQTRHPSEQTARHLKAMAGLAEAMAGRGYAWLTLNCCGPLSDARPFLAAGWTASPQYTYLVPIADLELLWSRVEHNLRRLIKRCEHEGMTVACDDDFEAFYQQHLSTMTRKDQGEYLPMPAFQRYFEELRGCGLCRLFHARLPSGRSVASQLVLLGPGGASHSVAAAADPEFLATGVSALLRWKVFEALSALGYRSNDLTDASLGPVTHFKSQLGGDLQLFLALEAPRSWRVRLGQQAGSLLRRWAGTLRSALGPRGGAERTIR